IGAVLLQHGGQCNRRLDVELAFPEAIKHPVVIAAEDAVPLRIQHADIREGRIEDLARAADREAAQVGFAAAIHVAVLDPPPLVSVLCLFQDVALRVDLGTAEIRRNVERVRKPLERDAGLLLELVREVLGEERVRALVVAVEPDYARSRQRMPWRRNTSASFSPLASASRVSFSPCTLARAAASTRSSAAF